jgi:hypothetical protein
MRFRSVWLNTIPGTNPPPAICTFFHAYGSLAAAIPAVAGAVSAAP